MRISIYLTLVLLIFGFCGCSDNKPEDTSKVEESLSPPSKSTSSAIEVNPLPVSPEDQAKANQTPDGMAFIKGGCFLMGNDYAQVDERPAHEVCIEDFYMGKTEVTQKRWQSEMGFNPSKFINENNPVEQVNFYDIQQFIKKSSGACRLPTEAEWEYAVGIGIQAN